MKLRTFSATLSQHRNEILIMDEVKKEQEEEYKNYVIKSGMIV